MNGTKSRATCSPLGVPEQQLAIHGGPERRALLLLAALLTLGAAIIHVVAASTHLGQSAVLAAALGAGGALQLAAAAALVAIPSHRLIAAFVALNLVAVGLWMLAHTVGLPVGAVW